MRLEPSWPIALPIIRSRVINQDQEASCVGAMNTHLIRRTVVDVPKKTRFTRKAHGHAAQYAQTGQSVHSSVYCVQWNFWTKFELSELFEAYLLLKDRTNAERGAPGSGTPIGRTGPRSGGGSQVKIMCWQVSTDTPPGTREARVREWAERSLENASWLPIDCVGVDATMRGCGPAERKCVDDENDCK